MRKGILIGLILFLLILIASSIYIWQFSGIRQHLEYTNYINSILDETERTARKDMFFSLSNPNYYAGTMIWLTHTGVLVWGKSGIKHFTFTQDAAYYVFANCSEAGNQAMYALTPHPNTIRMIALSGTEEWGGRVKSGSQVSVAYDPQVKSGLFKQSYHTQSISSNPDFSLENFVICFTKSSPAR